MQGIPLSVHRSWFGCIIKFLQHHGNFCRNLELSMFQFDCLDGQIWNKNLPVSLSRTSWFHTTRKFGFHHIVVTRVKILEVHRRDWHNLEIRAFNINNFLLIAHHFCILALLFFHLHFSIAISRTIPQWANFRFLDQLIPFSIASRVEGNEVQMKIEVNHASVFIALSKNYKTIVVVMA